MEIRVSIEVTGPPEEVGSLLGRLSEVLANGDELESSDTIQPWTSDSAAEFVGELTDLSLQALGIIASHAPRARFVDVRRDMAKLGLTLTPGSLSSIGFAMRRLGYANPPFLRDYYQRAYLMDSDIAGGRRPATEKELHRRSLQQP
jgi:hypothetical protein